MFFALLSDDAPVFGLVVIGGHAVVGIHPVGRRPAVGREAPEGEGRIVQLGGVGGGLCHRYGVPLLIDDNVDVALKSGADGVHVGIEDTPVAEIRARAGRDFIIGATAKTVEQARAAQAAGADYLGVGAVFPSPTKKNAVRITVEQLRDICGSVTIPAVAIGGISLDNIRELRGGGMRGVAVISALFGADDIAGAARALKQEALSAVTR